MNPDNPNFQGNINPGTSYSTIFQCSEDGLTCSLRFLEGVISLCMFVIFVRGYRILTKENNNPISKDDKRIYMLAMSQTLILALYYFIFQEFFILATIRNLLIWISINVLDVLLRIYYLEDINTLNKMKIVINALKVLNFLTWFVIAVGDGSEIKNTSFNLGYNCLILDWVFLSSLLFILTLFQGALTYQIVERLNWQLKQPSAVNDSRNLNSINQERINIMLLSGGSIAGAFIMFIWDYLAHIIAENDQMCVEIFSGNTFFRKILCFLLKIISMQVVPSIVYFIVFHKRKGQFLIQTPQRHASDIDYLDDDAASDLNRTLTSRSDSRRSLFSGNGSTPNL